MTPPKNKPDRGNALKALALGGALWAMLGAPLRADEVVATPVPEAPLRGLVEVIDPAARVLGVSDTQQLLALGNNTEDATQLQLFTLDHAGLPSAKPTSLAALPKPATLAKYKHVPLALLFSPRLALLYVWQDITDYPAPTGRPQDNPVFKDFDHLLIYQVAGGQLQLVKSTCRGPEYGYGGIPTAVLALSPDAKRLFVPNLRVLPGGAAGVGYVDLDVTGVPINNAAGQADLTILDTSAVPGAVTYYGCVPFAHTAIITEYVGLATWDLDDRRARLTYINLQTPTYYVLRAVGHPNLPVVYADTVGYPYLYRVKEEQGYITMVPQRLTLGGASPQGFPVVMARRGQIAVGGVNTIYVANIDEHGDFKPEATQTHVINASVQAMAYSSAFDRLYVTIEKLPTPPTPPPAPVKKGKK